MYPNCEDESTLLAKDAHYNLKDIENLLQDLKTVGLDPL